MNTTHFRVRITEKHDHISLWGKAIRETNTSHFSVRITWKREHS